MGVFLSRKGIPLRALFFNSIGLAHFKAPPLHCDSMAVAYSQHLKDVVPPQWPSNLCPWWSNISPENCQQRQNSKTSRTKPWNAKSVTDRSATFFLRDPNIFADPIIHPNSLPCATPPRLDGLRYAITINQQCYGLTPLLANSAEYRAPSAIKCVYGGMCLFEEVLTFRHKIVLCPMS